MTYGSALASTGLSSRNILKGLLCGAWKKAKGCLLRCNCCKGQHDSNWGLDRVAGPPRNSEFSRRNQVNNGGTSRPGSHTYCEKGKNTVPFGPAAATAQLNISTDANGANDPVSEQRNRPSSECSLGDKEIGDALLSIEAGRQPLSPEKDFLAVDEYYDAASGSNSASLYHEIQDDHALAIPTHRDQRVDYATSIDTRGRAKDKPCLSGRSSGLIHVGLDQNNPQSSRNPSQSISRGAPFTKANILEGLRTTLELLQDVAKFTPFPTVKLVIDLGLRAIAHFESIGEVDQLVLDLQTRITSFLESVVNAAHSSNANGEKQGELHVRPETLSNDIEVLKGSLSLILKDLEDINNQGSFRKNLLPNFSKMVIQQCTLKFQDVAEQFEARHILCTEGDIARLRTNSDLLKSSIEEALTRLKLQFQYKACLRLLQTHKEALKDRHMKGFKEAVEAVNSQYSNIHTLIPLTIRHYTDQRLEPDQTVTEALFAYVWFSKWTQLESPAFTETIQYAHGIGDARLEAECLVAMTHFDISMEKKEQFLMTASQLFGALGDIPNSTSAELRSLFWLAAGTAEQAEDSEVVKTRLLEVRKKWGNYTTYQVDPLLNAEINLLSNEVLGQLPDHPFDIQEVDAAKGVFTERGRLYDAARCASSIAKGLAARNDPLALKAVAEAIGCYHKAEDQSGTRGLEKSIASLYELADERRNLGQ